MALPITSSSIAVPSHMTVRRTTQTYERVMADLVPAWAERFRLKSLDYSSETGLAEPHRVLGVAGQFSDIWRKIWKLKKVMWNGEELIAEDGETEERILEDLISHCFLALDMLREKNGGAGPCPEKRS